MRAAHCLLAITAGLFSIATPFVAKRVSALPGASGLTAEGQMEGQAPSTGSKPAAAAQAPHRDHNPKHGGQFFMSLDKKHHLEGVLLAPGIFRVYLYDQYTKPLKSEQTKQASGTVQVGDSERAAKIVLKRGMNKETLEASLGNEVKFPVVLTLLLHLPGMKPDAKPELFNFKFAQFTVETGPGGCSPMPGMPNMGC